MAVADIITQTLGGGVAGGFLSSLIFWVINSRREKNERRDKFEAALKLVLNELSLNRMITESFIEHKGRSHPGKLRDFTYRSAQFQLAQDLPSDEYLYDIAPAYELLPLVYDDMLDCHSSGKMTENQVEMFKEFEVHLSTAIKSIEHLLGVK